MNPDVYQERALTKMADQDAIRIRTASLSSKMTQLDNGTRGIGEEAGECLAVVKRHLEYGKPLDRDRLIDECGDVLWRVAQTLDAVGATMTEAMEKNLLKLGIRYKEGFTQTEAADENRDREAEAKAQGQPLLGKKFMECVVADTECTIPPKGWRCTRMAGHEGPCAAIGINEAYDDLNTGKKHIGQIQAALENGEYDMKCQYCDKLSVCVVEWFRGPPGKPGPVKVPYCGTCSLKDALAKRGMTAPVKEGEDYRILLMAKVVQDGHGFGHKEDAKPTKDLSFGE